MIFEVFDEKNNLVKEYKHWKLLVRKNHTFLGSCVAVTKHHHARFSEASDEEMTDYANVVRDVEAALKKSFKFDAIHHIMLMLKDKHTHFHILPRYKTPRDFAGKEWKDDFKNPLGRKADVSQETLNKIRDELKKQVR